MKAIRTLVITALLLLPALSVASAQTWTPLTHQPTFGASTALLLTDGTVMVHDGGQNWWKLSPDITGSYKNGTWAQMASLPAGYSPLYYASAVLPDGRLVVIGGEYNFGSFAWTNLGAIYSPKTNKWAKLKHPPAWTSVGDAQSAILPNGQMMLANALTSEQSLLDAKTLIWSADFATGKADGNDEEGWTLLPNGRVLTVNANLGVPASEIFDPATGVWTSAGSTVQLLTDPGSHEIGPAVLLPDGTVLATGATGHNAVYNSTTGTWSAAPDFPKVPAGQLDIADGPAALLPNGNVLCMTSPGVFNTGVRFFEWNGTAFKQVASTPLAPVDSSYFGRMLVLPSGQILLTDGSTDVELYNPTGSANPAWAPTISKVATTLTHGKSYLLTGTQLNGLSQGAAYGDDAQAATNYPLVRITNTASSHVFYARTHNHSSMGVATGAALVTTHFDVPAGIELGASKLQVVANGIASTAVAVTIN